LANPCVFDLATGVYEAGTLVAARISAPPEGPQHHPPCFLYLRYQTCSSEVERSGTGRWPSVFNLGDWMGDSAPEVKERVREICTIYTTILSKRMSWVCHVARMREGEVCTEFWYGNLTEGDQLI